MNGESDTLIRCIVVDDEELARALVLEYLARHDDIRVVAECANGFDAVKSITELAPDLVFLDVQMPKLTGFEVLELLGEPCRIIFTTAYDQYAVRAFEVHAVDYLLKPFSSARFDAALDRARAAIRADKPADTPALARDVRAERAPLDRLLVRDGSRVFVIPVDTVDYIEAQDDYICIHAGGKRHLKQERIARIEEHLDPARFVRIHRSFIVNLARIARIEPYTKDSRVAVLVDGRTLPVSRSGFDRLRGLTS